MSRSSMRRTPSLQLVVPTPIAGSVRVICPREAAPRASRPLIQRKRKANEISVTMSIEHITMSASPSCSSPTPSRRLASTLPQLEIPQYRPQFASTPIDSESRSDGDPPSPTTTDIIDVEAGDFTRTAQRHGVRVHDYALEPRNSFKNSPVKEYWDPLASLLRHDIHIRKPKGSLGAHRLTGKDLWRLLDSGWVVVKEANRHWSAEDWKAMKAYRDRPGGPYPYVIGYARRKPVAGLRIHLRKSAFPAVQLALSDEDIYIPDDEPGMWTGEADVADSKGHADEDVRAGKRRKVHDNNDEANTGGFLPALRQMVSATSQLLSPTPSGTATTPLTSSASLGRTTSLTATTSTTRRSLRRNHTLVRVR